MAEVTAQTQNTRDRAWFAEYVQELLPALYGTARRLCRHGVDAEDLVAEAVTKAWEALPGLRDRQHFRGWLFRILTTTFISQYRARQRHGETESLDMEGEEFSLFERLHQPFLLWWGNPEQDFLNRLLRDDLVRAIEQLPPTFRATVVLVDVQGLTYQEVADALEVPVGTVRSRLARGRSLLQKALWDNAHDAGLRPKERDEEMGQGR